MILKLNKIVLLSAEPTILEPLYMLYVQKIQELLKILSY